jgi:hypothetical protein
MNRVLIKNNFLSLFNRPGCEGAGFKILLTLFPGQKDINLTFFQKPGGNLLFYCLFLSSRIPQLSVWSQFFDIINQLLSWFPGTWVLLLLKSRQSDTFQVQCQYIPSSFS